MRELTAPNLWSSFFVFHYVDIHGRKIYKDCVIKHIMNIDKEKISRIEIIGKGREYVNMDCKINDISIQDDGRTMKIFLEEVKDNDSH